MERITISIDGELARAFDAWMVARGYLNRSEAVRDLVREKLGSELLSAGKLQWGIATLTYVVDHTESTVAQRVSQWQHDHHDLVVTSHSVPLDHHDCLHTVVVRGNATHIEASARQLLATTGVRHGYLHCVPLRPTPPHTHTHSHGDAVFSPLHHPLSHRHLQPVS